MLSVSGNVTDGTSSVLSVSGNVMDEKSNRRGNGAHKELTLITSASRKAGKIAIVA